MKSFFSFIITVLLFFTLLPMEKAIAPQRVISNLDNIKKILKPKVKEINQTQTPVTTSSTSGTTYMSRTPITSPRRSTPFTADYANHEDIVLDMHPNRNNKKKNRQKRAVLSEQDTTPLNAMPTNDAMQIFNKIQNNPEAWQILAIANPTLHKFCVDNNLSIEQFTTYSSLLQEHRIEPQAIVDYVKNSHDVSKDLPNSSTLVKQYKNMQNNDPQAYQLQSFALIKALFDKQGEGGAPSSIMHSTYINALHSAMEADNAFSKKTLITSIITGLLLIAGTATGWITQSQVGSPANGTHT